MFPNIFAAMAANNRMTIKQLGREVGISAKSMSNKLNKRTEFTRSEMLKIQKILGNAPLDELFYESPSPPKIMEGAETHE